MGWGLDMDGLRALGLVVCGLVVCARLPWPHAYASVHGSSRSALANEVACMLRLRMRLPAPAHGDAWALAAPMPCTRMPYTRILCNPPFY